MEIRNWQNSEKVSIKNVDPASLFEWQGAIYMRVLFDGSGPGYKAINVWDGRMVTFNGNDEGLNRQVKVSGSSIFLISDSDDDEESETQITILTTKELENKNAT